MTPVSPANDTRRVAGSSLYRLKKENRLLNAAAFARVFKDPDRSRDRYFTVLSRPNDRGAARLGIAVSKKRCRKATARNRIRRIIRESFRHAQADIGGLDVIVMNQPAAAEAGNRELFDSLARHWQRCRGALPAREDPADG